MWTLAFSFALALFVQNFNFNETERKGFFRFETPSIKGIIRADGKSQGIVELVDKATGKNIARPALPGFLSLYRVFTKQSRFPDPRTSPLKASLEDEGRVLKLKWQRGAEWPFQLSGSFKILNDKTLELEVEVLPQRDLEDFEIFVSNYAALEFRHFLFLKRTFHLRPAPSLDLFKPKETAFFKGCYLAFPRDLEAEKLFFDGRWQRPPHPVHWALGRFYAFPLAGTWNDKTGLCALLMALEKQCFAIETTYAPKGRFDSVAGHNSIYLSLGGRNFKRGSKIRFHLALYVGKLPNPEKAIEVWRSWKRTQGPESQKN